MINKMTLLLASLFLVAFLGACDANDGPAEEAGEKLDDTAEEIEDAGEDVGDNVKDTYEDVTDEN